MPRSSEVWPLGLTATKAKDCSPRRVAEKSRGARQLEAARAPCPFSSIPPRKWSQGPCGHAHPVMLSTIKPTPEALAPQEALDLKKSCYSLKLSTQKSLGRPNS
jgi:hypothetical protein